LVAQRTGRDFRTDQPGILPAAGKSDSVARRPFGVEVEDALGICRVVGSATA